MKGPLTVRTTRAFTAAVCSAVVALSAASDAVPAAGSARATSITIAVLPVEPTAQAFYAKQRGFFLKQGIDAKITVLADAPQVVATVLSGGAQFSSLSIGGLAILKSRGAPVRVVAAGAMYRRQASTTGLVAGSGKRIGRARDLVGKRIAIDAKNTIAHIGLLRWLKRNGVAADDVHLVEIPFAQMLGPLTHGDVDAAVLPEPFVTLAAQRGLKRVANIFDAVCARNCLATGWMARKDVDPELAARFRNAIQAAAVWANKKQNARASGTILQGYVPIDTAVVRKMTRTHFATRLRPGLAQPWLDAFAEFGVIPASFSANDLVK
jgi:NitT/TauT family transport system substrate-binding protein